MSAGIRVIRDVIYRVSPQVLRRLDLYLPPEDLVVQGRFPAILAIHGGSWVGGSKEDFGPTMSRLAEHGFVVAAINYRLARFEDPSWPDVYRDVSSALTWINTNSAVLGVDSNKTLALGTSAGAHLAATLGLEPSHITPHENRPSVRGVICLSGAFDLVELVRQRRLGHEPLALLTGRNPADASSLLRSISPLHGITPRAAPMLLIHGHEDLWVPCSQSLRMAETLDRARVFHQTLIIPGARHGFGLLVRTQPTRDLVEDILSFTKKLW